MNIFKTKIAVAGSIFEPHPPNFGNQYNFRRCSNNDEMNFWFLNWFQIFKVQCGSVPSISVAVLALACTSNESGLSCQLDCVFYGYKTFLPHIFQPWIFQPRLKSWVFHPQPFFQTWTFQLLTFQNSGLKSLELKATRVRTFQHRTFQPQSIEKFMVEKSGVKSWVGNVL